MDINALYTLFRKSAGIGTDTRADLNNKIFFCLKGPNFDANTFAEKALEEGALHVVADDTALTSASGISVVNDVLTTLQDLALHHRRQFRFPVIGLTGSNGKTTHKELIAAVLARKFRTFSTRGNLNNHIGVPLTLLEIPLDAEIAVIEMGANHQGEIRDLSAICEPDYGLITNIGKAHLEGFGGIEGVRKGKGELFDFLRKKPEHLVFINGDDPVLNDMAKKMNCLMYGTDKHHFISGTLLPQGNTVRLQYCESEFESEEIHSRLAGDYNFINILAAICIGRYFEVPHADVKAAIEAYTPKLNRSQLEQTAHNLLLMDAYNANPSSMKLALGHFASMQAENKMAILGHMLELGESSEEEHQEIITLLRLHGLRAILVGNHFGNAEKEGFMFFNDTHSLLEYLKAEPIKNSTILLKGSRMVALEKAKVFL